MINPTAGPSIRCFTCLGRKWVHKDNMTGHKTCPDCRGTGIDEKKTEELLNDLGATDEKETT